MPINFSVVVIYLNTFFARGVGNLNNQTFKNSLGYAWGGGDGDVSTIDGYTTGTDPRLLCNLQ
jgi:hypothetical protein